MTRFLFVLSSLLLGLFLQQVCFHYFSLFGSGPQIVLLGVVAIGFLQGPVLGETLGFFSGLLLDAMGVSLFGLHALMLTMAGYLSGMLRRRVASERPTAQLAIGFIATLFYTFGSSFIFFLFEGGKRFSILTVVLSIFFNVLVSTLVFAAVERWLILWRMESEHI